MNRLLYAAFVLSLLAGNAWAAGSCVRPQDVTALRTAALQQQLMVAALTCHDVAAYNRFVISHQGALQVSDKALMDFFALPLSRCSRMVASLLASASTSTIFLLRPESKSSRYSAVR